VRKINADVSRPREQIENAGVRVEDAKKHVHVQVVTKLMFNVNNFAF